MTDVESVIHTAWDCKYHLVWVPKIALFLMLVVIDFSSI
jgi:hypothetical protein